MIIAVAERKTFSHSYSNIQTQKKLLRKKNKKKKERKKMKNTDFCLLRFSGRKRKG